MTELGLLARTLMHLRPAQLTHRARLRVQQAAVRRFPETARRVLAVPPLGTAAGWPDDFSPVDAGTPGRWPGPAELRSGKITLLGVTRELRDGPGWEHRDAPRLWRFHVYYWDWAWGLAGAEDRAASQALFARLWRSWQASIPFGHGDAWMPYPAALRAWSWCGLHRDLVTGTDLEPEFIRGLAAHAGFLRRHLEYDVGGNHLIKGLKALAGLAVFFGDERLLRLATRRLTAQLARQVLPDGGHYERAPAYHCQVLGDLLDVAGILRATGHAPAGELSAAISRMRVWVGAVLAPDGQVPLLNDGFPVDTEFLAALRPGPAPDEPLLLLPQTGLVRAVAWGWHMLADVGPPCPRSLPAHAHADTLSCLLYVDGVPLLADTGTSTYDPGHARDYERSTAAHSTVQVDGANSTEVWGAFRAGRRARVIGLGTFGDASGIVCEAAHDGFRALPGHPLHHRRWFLTRDGLAVLDQITGRGRHSLISRWRLAPGCQARVEGGTARITGKVGAFQITVAASGPAVLAVANGPVATGLGTTVDAPVLSIQMDAVLPASITMTLRRLQGEA
jgi:uncharacterized heparinase superfamily protein